MRLKTIIAIILIIVSLAGMFYWESAGREKLLMTEVLVAAQDIPAGKKIDLTDLSTLSLPSSDLSPESLSIKDAGSLVGMRSVVSIPQNMQLASSYFTSADREFSRGQSIYVIPGSWICEASSSLRAGDRVSVFLMPEFRYMGQFTVAFVKDESTEDVSAETAETDENSDTPLGRSAGPNIGNVEIICSFSQYKLLYNAMTAESEPDVEDSGAYDEAAAPEQSLLIVQEMGI